MNPKGSIIIAVGEPMDKKINIRNEPEGFNNNNHRCKLWKNKK